MASTPGRTQWLIAVLLILAGFLISQRLIALWTPPPTLILEMSSTATSTAQIYYDAGQGFNEADSVTAPVNAGPEFRELRFTLPRATLHHLRFDPLTHAGTVEIRHLRIVEGEGRIVRDFSSAAIQPLMEIRTRKEQGGVVHIETVGNAKDPALLIQFTGTIPLQQPPPDGKTITALTLLNLPILLIALALLASGLRARVVSAIKALDERFAGLGARISSPRFLTFDSFSIWFFALCAIVFAVSVAADLNGSSMEFNTRVFHQYGPQTVLAGKAKGIRSDEWNFMSPDMFYQVLRYKQFDAADTPFGRDYAGLMGNVPVRHITTIFRPQFWSFFVLPLDYAFSVYWQMKWLIMLTGTFLLFLLLTGSSWLSVGGALLLFYSAATQWTYSWPSMLPEMCGMFCFVLVLAMYLTLGTKRWMLAICSLLLAACAVNFALFSYVPHMIPYLWTGVFLFGGWVYARHEEILSNEGRLPRIAAFAGAVLLAGVMLGAFYKDAAPAIAGIGATEYPGHRSLDGGEMWLPEFASHYYAPFEDENRFPIEMHNICESTGYLWLAPATLLCWAAMRALSRERQILLLCLWLPALLLLGWATLPLPAWLGRPLLLDKVAAQRTLPALGLLNTAIVMVVLSSSGWKRSLNLETKLLLAAPVVFLSLAVANSLQDGFFTGGEIGITGAWVSLLAGLVWDGRPRAFLSLALLPSIYFFALINPISRGIGAITASPLYGFVQSHQELRQGRWLVMANEGTFGIFPACGLDSYSGMHYLPPVEDFPIFQRHGVAAEALNQGGMFVVKPIPPGQKSEVESLAEGVSQWNVNPMDPLIRDLGIRYIAFERQQPPAILEGLQPLAAHPISGFWLYALARSGD